MICEIEPIESGTMCVDWREDDHSGHQARIGHGCMARSGAD